MNREDTEIRKERMRERIKGRGTRRRENIKGRGDREDKRKGGQERGNKCKGKQ